MLFSGRRRERERQHGGGALPIGPNKKRESVALPPRGSDGEEEEEEEKAENGGYISQGFPPAPFIHASHSPRRALLRIGGGRLR